MALPEPGQIVRVRSRQFLVEEVGPAAPGRDTRVRMSCVDDDAQGEELEVLWERGRLCSHDPVCAYHQPSNPHEERFLHGAACHACVLVSETSCEQRNELLDRALVVPTVESAGAAFFGDR